MNDCRKGRLEFSPMHGAPNAARPPVMRVSLYGQVPTGIRSHRIGSLSHRESHFLAWWLATKTTGWLRGGRFSRPLISTGKKGIVESTAQMLLTTCSAFLLYLRGNGRGVLQKAMCGVAAGGWVLIGRIQREFTYTTSVGDNLRHLM